jgi:pilus assembly protein CpaB
MARTAAGALPGRTNRKFLIVALLFGALTAVLFYALTANRTSNGKSSTTSSTQTQVVVARVPIRQRTSITADMLEIKSVPADARVTGAVAAVTDVVGKVTKFPIDVNQQVSTSAIVDTTRPAAAAALDVVIPAGRRAMSIQASQVQNAGGLILPGDYVDLVWICCADKLVVAKTLFRNVQVAAIDQTIISSGPVAVGSSATPAAGTNEPIAADVAKAVPSAVTMTLLLTPAESQQLFLAELTGKLRAVLRNVGDQDVANTPPSTYLDIAPVDLLKALPDALRPDGFKQ